MIYQFKGKLCGYLCSQCSEPLANVNVRLYRVDREQNIEIATALNPKDSFTILDDQLVQDKASRLFAETVTDNEGNFIFRLGENYRGEAFEVDVYCASVPRQKIGKTPPKPLQFTITTLQPSYEESENGFVAVWEYCLPYRYWCAILAKFDVWTICGKILDCQTRRPIAGLKVLAFDTDWVADDSLGSALTDSSGKFVITYSSADFKKGTWINVELIGGPDLYFRIEDAIGNALLAEPRSRGRKPDRENASNCFCVELCVKDPVKCELTAPSGCTPEEADQTAGINFVRVFGTASGGGFGSYILELLQSGSPVSGVSVTYPGGGTSGTIPVIAGELGQIDTTAQSDGAYSVRLTLYSAGPGSTILCSKILDFTLLKVFVYMNKVGSIPTDPQPLDPASELRLAGVPKAVGGTLSIEGAAYIYGCIDRKIKKYDIRTKRVTTPGSEPAQPATDDSIPAGWSVISPLPLEYTLPSQYQPWNRIGPAPRDLINTWKTFTVGGTTYYALSAGKWGSADSGRYSLLQVAEDSATPSSHLFYDIQHIWLDNKQMYYTVGSETLYTVRIVKFQRLIGGVWSDIPPCMDLQISFGKIRIVGLAWDPIIDEAWWPPVAPNDNFSHYRLDFWKQFGPAHELLGNTFVRVPALPPMPPVSTPTYADAEELAVWDLTLLDAGAPPSPYAPPPDPKIYRGVACTYNLQLFGTDSTAVNDNSTSHYVYHQVGVKIVNNL